MSVDLVLHEDGSGSTTGSMHLDREVWELLVGIGGLEQDDEFALEEVCKATSEELLETDSPSSDDEGFESVVEMVVDDSGCNGTFTTTWTADHAERLAPGLGKDGGSLFQRNDHGWRFELDMNIVQEQFGFERNADLTALITDQPTLTISVTLPGEVNEHNADSRDGSTFRWHVVLSDIAGTPDTLYAGSAPSGSGFPTLLAVIVAAAVLLVLALVWFLRRRSTRTAGNGSAPPLHHEE